MVKNENRLLSSIKRSSAVIFILLLVFLLCFILPIDGFGIRPRTIPGLIGILLAPLLHVNFSHLFANSLGFFMLGTVFFMVEKRNPYIVLAHFVLLGGFGTWLIGRPFTNHIGLSGVLYAIMGYLMSLGFFQKKMSTILVSLVCFFLYGGALWGILPGNPLDSWESHLCGLVAGIATAWFYSRHKG